MFHHCGDLKNKCDAFYQGKNLKTLKSRRFLLRFFGPVLRQIPDADLFNTRAKVQGCRFPWWSKGMVGLAKENVQQGRYKTNALFNVDMIFPWSLSQ